MLYAACTILPLTVCCLLLQQCWGNNMNSTLITSDCFTNDWNNFYFIFTVPKVPLLLPFLQKTPLWTFPRMHFCIAKLMPTLPTCLMNGWNKDRMFTVLSEFFWHHWYSTVSQIPKIIFFILVALNSNYPHCNLPFGPLGKLISHPCPRWRNNYGIVFEHLEFEHFVFSRSLKSRVKILVDGTLFIPNLIPEDAGYYTCIPTNGILTPPSASAHLSVKCKPFFLVPHQYCIMIQIFTMSRQYVKNSWKIIFRQTHGCSSFFFLLLLFQILHVLETCPEKCIYRQDWREPSSALSRLIHLSCMLIGPRMDTVWILTRWV